METNRKIIELEDKISDLIFKDNGRRVRFEYKSIDYEISLDLIESAQPKYKEVSKKQVIAYTTNVENGENFILKSVTSDTYESALLDILTYVNNHKREMNSYTVIWTKKGTTSGKQNSYFYCIDIVDVINKFFDNKDRSEYIIYEIKLNPIS